MGPGSIAAAVADSGPLIHLSEIGSLNLLTLLTAGHVPAAAWAETVGRNRLPSPVLPNLHRQWLTPAQRATCGCVQSSESLQPGETECLILCRELCVGLLLTDDLAMRRIAPTLGITPVRSLGIIVRTGRAGMLEQAKAADRLLALQATSSLVVIRALVALAIQQLPD